MLHSRCFVKAVIFRMIDGDGKLIEYVISANQFNVANTIRSISFSIFTAASVQYFIIAVVYDYWCRSLSLLSINIRSQSCECLCSMQCVDSKRDSPGATLISCSVVSEQWRSEDVLSEL